MNEVSIRDLRNHGGGVMDRVARGERLTVTRDGAPVAELQPIPSPPLSAAKLLQRWRPLPAVDFRKLRGDLDRVLDASL